MKKLLLILLCLPMIGFGQLTYVPDNNFENALINLGLDNVLDSTVTTSAIDTVTNLVIMSLNISDLTGIEGFTALEKLNCSVNELTSLDLSQNTSLTDLICYANQLTNLNLNNNTALTYLDITNNLLSNLDINNNTSLLELDCSVNQLTSLDVSANTALTYLDCSWNYITTLNISQNLALVNLYCWGNLLTTLDVTHNLNLARLKCYYNQITFLDLGQNIDLTHLDCSFNSLGSLNVSNNINLTRLLCFNNDLTNINLINNIALTTLGCGNFVNNSFSNYRNQFTSLDISQNTSLTAFNVSGNPNLYCIDVFDVDWADTNWTVANGNIDSTMYFSTNCSLGCTDSLACNYSLAAITDDGSCLYSSLDTKEVISCDNYFWLTNGLLYDTSGIYTEFLTASNGCDSVVSLDLTVLNSTDTTYSIDTSVCEGFGLNGYYYSISATFLQEFPITQCDTHFIELNLDIIGNTTKSYDTIAIEGSYLWNGFTLTESGNYVFSTTNAQGCDSLVNLNLTILALTSLQENSAKKELLRITDLFGRETAYRKNTPLFYIYDDGTVEKKIVMD